MSIPTEEVITSILVTQVLSGVMLLLDRRLVSLLLGGLVVLEDKLLQLLPRLIRLKENVVRVIIFDCKFFSFVFLFSDSLFVKLFGHLLQNHFLPNIWSFQ